jgi:hypothetical protein
VQKILKNILRKLFCKKSISNVTRNVFLRISRFLLRENAGCFGEKHYFRKFSRDFLKKKYGSHNAQCLFMLFRLLLLENCPNFRQERAIVRKSTRGFLMKKFGFISFPCGERRQVSAILLSESEARFMQR